MKRFTRVLAAASLAFLFSACAAATSRVHYYAGEEYESRTPARRITIYEKERPERAFVTVGRIIVAQGFGGEEAVFDELRRKASEIGADAVIDLSYGEEQHEWGNPVIDKKEETKYKPGGSTTTTQTVVSKPLVSVNMTVSGLAIRFKENDKKIN